MKVPPCEVVETSTNIVFTTVLPVLSGVKVRFVGLLIAIVVNCPVVELNSALFDAKVVLV